MSDNTKNDMRKLTVSIPDDLDEQLREYVRDYYEGIKGGLSIVVKTSLREFLERQNK
jgi:Arc/MetJ-type ribon-helix-helix transcriptional regulator